MLQCEGHFRFFSPENRRILVRPDGSLLCRGCEVRRRSPFVVVGSPNFADDL